MDMDTHTHTTRTRTHTRTCIHTHTHTTCTHAHTSTEHHTCHSSVHLQTAPPLHQSRYSLVTAPLTWCCCRADLAKGCEQNWHGMRASSAVRGSGRWEDNKEWAQPTYVCTYVAHTVHQMSYMPSPGCTSALHLSVVTHGTLPLTRALQLTISEDRRRIGVALHLGGGFLLFWGRPKVSLHCTVGTTHEVK